MGKSSYSPLRKKKAVGNKSSIHKTRSSSESDASNNIDMGYIRKISYYLAKERKLHPQHYGFIPFKDSRSATYLVHKNHNHYESIFTAEALAICQAFDDLVEFNVNLLVFCRIVFLFFLHFKISRSNPISLKDTGSSKVSKNDTSDSDEKYWRKRNLGEFKYRIMSGMTCCGIGLIAGLICYYLPTRIVKLITLQKGGSTAVIVTHGPFGKTRSLKVPLHLLTCTVSRDQAKTYIPIKLKKRWFFYLVDCNGQFHQPALFDVTVGAKNW
ncbi:transmembrane protein [Trichonephila clavipes]|nr:transmembrane protein [Trichonephila clavipes]